MNQKSVVTQRSLGSVFSSFFSFLLLSLHNVHVTVVSKNLAGLVVPPFRNNLIFLLDNWHIHREGESASLPFPRVEPNFSVVALTQVLADDQTQPDALIIHLVDVLEFAKLLEQSLLVCLADTHACVLHLHHDLALFLDVRSIYLDEAVFAREFKRVLYQVDQHLLQSHLVSVYQLWHRLVDGINELLALDVGMSLEHEVGFVEHLLE